jgi:hypothetical protein
LIGCNTRPHELPAVHTLYLAGFNLIDPIMAKAVSLDQAASTTATANVSILQNVFLDLVMYCF